MNRVKNIFREKIVNKPGLNVDGVSISIVLGALLPVSSDGGDRCRYRSKTFTRKQEKTDSEI